MNHIRDIIFEDKSKLKLKENYIEIFKSKLEYVKQKEQDLTEIIKNQINQINNMEVRSVITVENTKENQIPRWMPNPLAKHCKMCHKRFGLITRKHHCRVCGDIFCSKCCSIFDNFTPYYQKNVRMCVECHAYKNKYTS
jgi:hypothetical protein